MTASRRHELVGVALVVGSAVAFGLTAVLAKLAFARGMGAVELLAFRFGLAALVLWAVVAVRRPARPGRRDAAGALGLGLVAYSLQLWLFFGALERMDASLASLLEYAYPALVVLGAVALGRERLTSLKAGGLAAALGGTALVLVGGGVAAVDPLGGVLALGSAAVYAAYFLASDSVLRRVDAWLLAALVCSGAALALGAAALATGSLTLALGRELWLLVAAVVLVSTVFPLGAVLVGIERIGPSRTAVLATLEPLVTIGLAGLVFGERLAWPQAAGAALVLGAIAVFQLRRRPRLAAVVSRVEPEPLPERAAA